MFRVLGFTVFKPPQLLKVYAIGGIRFSHVDASGEALRSVCFRLGHPTHC